MFLALRIEKNYSKEKILELYCNQFYLGHGVYGVETASNLFFGKSVSDLNLDEAAMIAGIFRGPSIYSPILTRKSSSAAITPNCMAEKASSESGDAAKASQ
jgi:membrane peptidoglycan carboxypeptidase